MAVTYPSNLPCPLLKGNSFNGGNTFKRSEFDYATRTRMSYCSDYYVEFSFVTKDAQQMLDFKNFYYTSLANGSRSFKANWEVEGSVSTKEFRFASVYKSSSLGKSIYQIKATFQMITKIKDI